MLLRLATGETPDFPARAGRCAGVWILHPGKGTVHKISGLKKARAIPGVSKVACTLRTGDHVSERLGSGDSKGRIVAEAASAQECAEALRQALEVIEISLGPREG
jgi:hypothetical protein